MFLLSLENEKINTFFAEVKALIMGPDLDQ